MTEPVLSAASVPFGARPGPGNRRLALLLLVLTLVAAPLALTTSPDPAGAADRPAASSSSAWLASKLENGTYRNPLASGPDHGLMIDAIFAMHASDDGHLARPILEVLDDGGEAINYISFASWLEGGEVDRIGGATAKTLVAALVSGRDPRNFGGLDLVAETRSVITPDGPERGRVRDFGPHISINNANTFDQALAVIGLAGVGENDQSAIDVLLDQQCSEGYFRIFASYNTDHSPATCDEGKTRDRSHPDGDATGLALSALLAARRAGATGLDGAIDRTVAWLVTHQDASGGWGGGVGTEAPNTNSTGLIVQALADAGAPADVLARGEAYLRQAQVTPSADAANELRNEIGAIAYQPDQYVAARATGLTHLDTWIRASAQASLGLSQVSFYRLVTGQVTDNPTPQPPPTTTTTVPAPPPPIGPSTNRPTSAETGTSPNAATTVAGSISPRAGTPGPSRGTTGRPVTPTDARIEATSPTPAGRLAAYLAGQLVDGDHIEVEVDGEQLVDYDATAETVLALHQLGEQPMAVERATRFLLAEASVDAYVHGAPYEDDDAAYAEPLAKLLLIGRFGVDPGVEPTERDHLAERLDRMLAGLVSDSGEAEDAGEFADRSRSVTRHGWVVLAGAATGSPYGHEAAELLASTQCDDGTFPVDLARGPCTSGDLLATAWAVQALNAATSPTPSSDASRRTIASRIPGHGLPAAWSEDRTQTLERGIEPLQAATGGSDLVLDDGEVDVTATAQVAAARQALGLDTTGTARALGELLADDGGFATPPVTPTPDEARPETADQDADENVEGEEPLPSDLATSIAVAPGLGTSLLLADGSPVTAVVRLPLSTSLVGATSPTDDATNLTVPAKADPRSADGSTSRWRLLALVLVLALVGGTAIVARTFRNRSVPT